MNAIVNTAPVSAPSLDVATVGVVATWTVGRVLTDSISKQPYAYIVRSGNSTAKLPVKHALRAVLKAEDQIELETYKIDTFDPAKPALLVSQKLPAARAFLQERVGAVVEGTVINVVEFGAFVDIGGGITGMVHKLALTAKMPQGREFWKGAVRAKEAAHSELKVGDKIRVVICDFQLQTDPRRLGEFKVELSQEQVGYSRLSHLLKTKKTPELKIQAAVLGQDQEDNYELGLFHGAEFVVAKLPMVELSCIVKRGDTVRVIVAGLEDHLGRTLIKVHHEDGAKSRAASQTRRQENRDLRTAKQPSKGASGQKPGKGSSKK